MKASSLYFPCLRDTPAEAEVISHQLMVRAGLIRKLASGMYTWLPLGLRVMRKIEAIVREELIAIGAQEIMMPSIQPADLWKESQRWHDYGLELLRLTDRHNREFCIGPTHEEVITDVLRGEIKSFRQLPLNFFQIQTKFRDEIRPRFGVMRSREFVMKDGYSFHSSKESLQHTYADYARAYHNIFSRIGLNYCSVKADSGSIGGDTSEEFHVLADSGEDDIAFSHNNSFAANVELVALPLAIHPQPAQQPLTKVATPNCPTIDAVAKFLQLPAQQTVKVMIFHSANSTPEQFRFIAVILRGDQRFNAVKLENHPKIAAPLQMANDTDIANLGLHKGYIGPIQLPIPVLCDNNAAELSDFVCGANVEGYHCSGVNWQRDAHYSEIADLRMAVAGDPSPDGNGVLQIKRGIEVGHIFQLGDTYSRKMQAMVTGENGEDIPMQMGCYGIGITRIVAAAIEQCSDVNGIIWPLAIAPFQATIIAIGYDSNQDVRTKAEEVYALLQARGIEVLLDDRDVRPGVKFYEHDLIGIPHRFTVGVKTLADGVIYYSKRDRSNAQRIAVAELKQGIDSLFTGLM